MQYKAFGESAISYHLRMGLMPHIASHSTNPEVDRCIDDCYNCATSCNTTVAYCLEKGGRHAEAAHIALMLDCASICETAASSMSRNSNVHNLICRACADICRKCESECRSFGDDPTMQECADVCRKCAESCDRMAA